MEQRYGTDPSRRYGTGVWNGGMERVWSRSLFRTSYFDLHPYIYIYVDAYAHTHIIHCHNVILSGLIFAEAATSSCMVIPFRSFRQAAAFAAASR